MVQENIIHSNCWFAYFDQLGFKNDIKKFVKSSPGNLDAFASVEYKSILDSIKYVLKEYEGEIIPWWFSDTFMFFSTDGTKGSFASLESAMGYFLTKVTWQRHPFRGAISYGELYADMENKILVSQALIEAHEYAEKQNWIGLVLTPSAREQLKNVAPKLSDGWLDCWEYDVPVCVDSTKKEGTEKLLVPDISRYPHIQESIEQMRQEAENTSGVQDRESIRVKYDNTIKFFDLCKNKRNGLCWKKANES
jgi:hypothetical protein